MAKTIEQWLLFKYIDGEFTPLSKPLKTKELAEKARSKYPERERQGMGVGVVRTKAQRRGLQESVEREAAVATAVPDPQGACYDGQQADLAKRAQAGAQAADDGIPPVQTEWPFALTVC